MELLHSTLTMGQDAPMADYDSRKIRGWRGRMEDAITACTKRMWQAPAEVIRLEGVEKPPIGIRYGYKLWFKRLGGPERAAAAAELRELQKVRRKSLRADRTPEEKDRDRAKNHEQYLKRKAAETIEGRGKRLAMQRERRATQSDEVRERANHMNRLYRKKCAQSPAWLADQALKKRLRKLAKPDLYRAIDRRTKEKRRDAINAKRRQDYAANPEKDLARRRAYLAAKREKAHVTSEPARPQHKSCPQPAR